MALTPEWLRRVDTWRRELPTHLYRPLGTVEWKGFVTTDQLMAAEAGRHSFAAMPPGTRWGAAWEYGWFRGSVSVPRDAAGRRLVVRPDLGGEGLLHVNGKVHAARDRQHEYILLARTASTGARFDLLAEVYAGHGPLIHATGPVAPGRLSVPPAARTQTVVGESTFGTWEEEVYQLHIDVETLYGLRSALDPDSLRLAEIDAGLRDFTTIVDFEVPIAEMLKTVTKCRRRLAQLLAAKNGTTAPVLHAFGHAHIDVAWLWPLAETERKAARTFSTQLGLLDEYPAYRFLQSTPQVYQMVKTRYPELYQRVQQAVRRGRVVAEGGMWVEADTNISGGEALVRQFLHGTKFFRAEFGVENELLWLPDVFGYSGALPQIMKGCGISYFSTAKIFWAYNGGETFPYVTFHWEGIDGSTVLAHFTGDYNSGMDPAAAVRRWSERPQKDGISGRMMPFGFGDGGGGPTRDHLEYARRLADLEGAPRVTMASPLTFFRAQARHAEGLPRYTGELYFQAHRGTYTSQAKTKRANRRTEVALREAEMWACAARAVKGTAVPVTALDAAWKLLLLNQFHDIIPGSSIARVYEDALAHHRQAQEGAASVTAAATAELAGGKRGRATAVFNSLSWERSALVELPGVHSSVTDAEGHELPVQTVEGKTLAEARVPSCGWTTVTPGPTGPAHPRPGDVSASLLHASRRHLENERIALAFNERGEITSIHDKEAGTELAAGPCNVMAMYKDVPSAWDAWDIDSMYGLTPVELPRRATIDVLDHGPLVARVRITRRINESDLVQVISLRRGSRRVDFHTTIEWRESHKLLKVCFPLPYRAMDALHEIQFGHITRPTHLSRRFDADRFEVCAHRWSALVEEGRGGAVLNDSKYGVNVLGGSINLTLLRAPLAPDMNADKGKQEFTYSLFTWNGPFSGSGVLREAAELNCPVVTAAGSPGERSLLRLNSPHVILEALKPAENGEPDLLVLRLYESMRTFTKCSLALDVPVATVEEADMRERVARALPVRDGKVALSFRPFEIKTILVRLAPAADPEKREGSPAARGRRR